MTIQNCERSERTVPFQLEQTPCLIRGEKGLMNEWILSLETEKNSESVLLMDGKPVWKGHIHAGRNRIVFYIPEPEKENEVLFFLDGYGQIPYSVSTLRHWNVHVVQLSHHDPGYTDVPSHVMEESTLFLNNALDDMDVREDYPEDSRYRIVVEQVYSLDRFLHMASEKDRARMLSRIRKGDVEITGLWANLISEILSPEEMLRALYPAERIAREAGVKILSAEHNDIPGFSWGYCTALCRAGIRFFVPGLPQYYQWGGKGLTSFWDDQKIIGRNTQGGFWWESEEGDRILFWHNDSGCGGPSDPNMPGLLPLLKQLTEAHYPHTVCRFPVQGADRDNSPYSPAFSDQIKAWNTKYVYPHLICSTESRFYQDFTDNLTVELPVWKGGVDGQDYPIASTSQMSSSALNRENHMLFRSAEMLCALTQDDPVMKQRESRLDHAVTDMLMADEHAFGFTFPACPGQRASFWEHGVYAARANADFHDVLSKSMASIADRIQGDPKSFRLTVVNTSGTGGLRKVCAKLRDLDNCGTQIGISKNGVNRIYELGNRMQVHPQEGYLQGRFRLRDSSNGRILPFSLRRVEWDDPSDLSASRAGIGAGTKRFGFFEDPEGTSLQIEFLTELPAYGYKSFELIPCEEIQAVPSETPSDYIENEFYRISFDRTGITDIWDKKEKSSLFDPNCPHRPLSILVRYGNHEAESSVCIRKVQASADSIGSFVCFSGSGDGIYDFTLKLSLYRGVDQVSADLRIVKSEKPLQSVFLCFPFRGNGVRYQGTLFEGKPVENLLPGSHSDVIAVQDWVCTEESDILWNSANAPVVSLSHLWEGYISPAHRGISDYKVRQPLTAADYDTGWIYSVLTCNNFDTNFYVSQLSSAVFHYSFAKRHGRNGSAWGLSVQNEPFTLLTDRSRGDLLPEATFLSAEGVRILALKPAENGNGLVLRVRNDSPDEKVTEITLWGGRFLRMTECDALERDIREVSGNTVSVKGNTLMTIRILPEIGKT